MYPNNEDTVVGARNAAQPNKAQNNSNETLKKVAAFAAGGVAGAAAAVGTGAAAAYAAGMFDPEEELQAQAVTTPANEEETTTPEEETAAAAQEAAAQQADEHTKEPEPEPAPAPKPEHHPEPEHRQDPNLHYASNTHTTGTEEPAFYRENDVRISSIETNETDDGDVVHVASGTVNGHDAVFLDDGHGNVQGYVVDLNDNSEIDDGEVVHTEGQGLTMTNLADHMVETEVAVTPANAEVEVTPASSEMQVVAVQNDVDMDGTTVDVAVVAVDNTAALLVDVDQNGEVDILSVDANHDGDFSADETEVVTDSHISMPTVDDVSTDLASNNELPDYSNDEDITIYDV